MTRTGKPHPLAVQLRQIRRRRRISQVRLAADIGVNELTVRRWETGRQDQWLRQASDWADALGYDLVLVSRRNRRRDPGWRREMQDPPRRTSAAEPRVMNTPNTPEEQP